MNNIFKLRSNSGLDLMSGEAVAPCTAKRQRRRQICDVAKWRHRQGEINLQRPPLLRLVI